MLKRKSLIIITLMVIGSIIFLVAIFVGENREQRVKEEVRKREKILGELQMTFKELKELKPIRKESIDRLRLLFEGKAYGGLPPYPKRSGDINNTNAVRQHGQELESYSKKLFKYYSKVALEIDTNKDMSSIARRLCNQLGLKVEPAALNYANFDIQMKFMAEADKSGLQNELLKEHLKKNISIDHELKLVEEWIKEIKDDLKKLEELSIWNSWPKLNSLEKKG